MKPTRISIALVAIAGLLALAPAVDAQTKPSTNSTPPTERRGPQGRMSVDDQLARLTEQLKLTDEQKPKVKAVLEEQFKQMQALRDLPQEDRRSKMQALREDTTKKMKEILTPEQFKKYEEGRPGPRGEHRSAPPAGENQAKPDAKK